MIIDDMIHGSFTCNRRIDETTPIIPRAIAEGVCEEAGVWLQQPLPRRWVRELVAHANTVFARNAQFRRKVCGQGNAGRDWLWMFMRHWLAALLKNRRPQGFARLPAGYPAGGDLPQPSPARRRNKIKPRKGLHPHAALRMRQGITGKPGRCL